MAGCCIIGTFSKTISPWLRLGFMVVPLHLALAFAETATCLALAPDIAVQHTVAEFIREGHYLRHLRKMKRLYAARQQRLADTIRELVPSGYGVDEHSGLRCGSIFRTAMTTLRRRNEPCNTEWRLFRCRRGTYPRQHEVCCWVSPIIPTGCFGRIASSSWNASRQAKFTDGRDKTSPHGVRVCEQA